jgi:hypothetical protein
MKNGVILLISFLFYSIVFAQKITEVKKEDLPQNILSYTRTNLKGSTIFKAVKLDDKGTMTYNVAIDVHGQKQILVFDKYGKFMKKGDDFPKSSKKTGKKKGTQQTNSPPQASQAKEPNNLNQNDLKK